MIFFVVFIAILILHKMFSPPPLPPAPPPGARSRVMPNANGTFRVESWIDTMGWQCFLDNMELKTAQTAVDAINLGR